MSPSNKKEESCGQDSTGNAGLYFVNQVSLTVMCVVKFHMYLTTKSFLSQSKKTFLSCIML